MTATDGEPPPRIARPDTGAIPTVAPESGARTHIIRRAPSGGLPELAPTSGSSPQPGPPDDVKTGLIAPVPSEALTGLVAPSETQPDAPTGLIPRPPVDFRAAPPSPTLPAITTGFAILSGWATGVIATDLITSWWSSDTLFCVAVAFLATIAGVPLLLLRRRLGSLLIVAGAVASLLMFAGLFVAGAAVPWVVYTIPVLPVASAGFAVHPQTRRWWRAS